MKYTTEITVELPLDEFIKKLDNSDNMRHWQRGLVSYEHVSGMPGEVGAKMKLNYKMGKRDMELIETIIHHNLPHELYVNYDMKGMHNIQENFFEETNNGQTKWISKNEFVPTNFMLRMMTMLMPRAFKKQSKKYLQDFKNFAENGISLANE